MNERGRERDGVRKEVERESMFQFYLINESVLLR
jgi:hypothetical protein